MLPLLPIATMVADTSRLLLSASSAVERGSAEAYDAAPQRQLMRYSRPNHYTVDETYQKEASV